MKRMRIILLITVMLLIPSRAVQAAPMQVPKDVKQLSVELGELYNICPELIQAMCFKESSFNPRAENDGCIGIMQVNPI